MKLKSINKFKNSNDTKDTLFSIYILDLDLIKLIGNMKK